MVFCGRGTRKRTFQINSNTGIVGLYRRSRKERGPNDHVKTRNMRLLHIGGRRKGKMKWGNDRRKKKYNKGACKKKGGGAWG